MVLLMGNAHTAADIGGVVAAVVAVLGITLISLFASTRLVAVLGVTGTNVIGRVLGVVLAALAAQFVIDGIYAWWPNR